MPKTIVEFTSYSLLPYTIHYQEDELDDSTRVAIPKEMIGSHVVEHTFSQDENFIKACEAAYRDPTSLIYQIGTNPGANLTLAKIESTMRNYLTFERITKCCPIYSFLRRIREERKPKAYFAYRYVKQEGTPLTFGGSTRDLLRQVYEDITDQGFYWSEAEAYKDFVVANPDTIDAIRERYLVQVTHDNVVCNFTSVVTLSNEPAFPELEVCSPVMTIEV